jgi:hypothetical protein
LFGSQKKGKYKNTNKTHGFSFLPLTRSGLPKEARS